MRAGDAVMTSHGCIRPAGVHLMQAEATERHCSGKLSNLGEQALQLGHRTSGITNSYLTSETLNLTFHTTSCLPSPRSFCLPNRQLQPLLSEEMGVEICVQRGLLLRK